MDFVQLLPEILHSTTIIMLLFASARMASHSSRSTLSLVSNPLKKDELRDLMSMTETEAGDSQLDATIPDAQRPIDVHTGKPWSIST